MNWRRSRSASRKSSVSASSTIAWSCTASRSTAIARIGAGRVTVRAAVRIAGLLGLFAVLGPLHILTKALLGRSRWPRRFLAGAAWVCGARVRLEGEPIRGPTLLVPNHTSWLDILIL